MGGGGVTWIYLIIHYLSVSKHLRSWSTPEREIDFPMQGIKPMMSQLKRNPTIKLGFLRQVGHKIMDHVDTSSDNNK